MKKIVFACLCLALVAGSACVPSLHGIYCEKTQVFEENLLGFWSEVDDGECWRFTRGENGAYHALFINEDGKGDGYDARLVDLKGSRYLDLYPDGQQGPESGGYVATHLILRVKELGPRLCLEVMDPKGLEKILKENSGLVKHERVRGEDLLLTASTRELQSFLIKEGWREELFTDLDPMIRLIPVQ